MGFTESDWKLFRNKIADWQENYIDKLNNEYIELLNSDTSPSKKFWELEKRINNDKQLIGVAIILKRSSMINNLVSLLNDGVITNDDLSEFSDELKTSIHLIMK